METLPASPPLAVACNPTWPFASCVKLRLVSVPVKMVPLELASCSAVPTSAVAAAENVPLPLPVRLIGPLLVMVKLEAVCPAAMPDAEPERLQALLQLPKLVVRPPEPVLVKLRALDAELV